MPRAVSPRAHARSMLGPEMPDVPSHVPVTTTDAMQIAFARLACDASARDRFIADPVREAEPLAALPGRAIVGYARGLLAKRLHEASRLLPVSAREPDFSTRFVRYAAERPIGGSDRHRHDAIAFARELGTPTAKCERYDLEARAGERCLRLAFARGRFHWWVRVARGAELHRSSLRFGWAANSDP